MGECGLTQVKLGFNAWSPSWHLVFADRAAAEMPTREEVNDIKDLIECFLSTQAPDRRIGWTFLIKNNTAGKKEIHTSQNVCSIQNISKWEKVMHNML